MPLIADFQLNFLSISMELNFRPRASRMHLHVRQGAGFSGSLTTKMKTINTASGILLLSLDKSLWSICLHQESHKHFRGLVANSALGFRGHGCSPNMKLAITAPGAPHAGVASGFLGLFRSLGGRSLRNCVATVFPEGSVSNHCVCNLRIPALIVSKSHLFQHSLSSVKHCYVRILWDCRGIWDFK